MLDLEYELIDCGDKRRLERFGDVILDRPCPQALWPKKLNIDTWKTATGFYERFEESKGWKNLSEFKTLPKVWTISLDKLVLELRPSENNQIGIFPEQLSNWSWINNIIKENSNRPLKILNCFSYTGIASIVASYSGDDNIEVCHVDGAKASVNWAKKNANLSGLDSKKIRWIVDDVTKFLTREIKRGNKYDGIILDPPAFGRGSKTSSWKFDKDLLNLLKLVNQLLSEKPLFIVLSGHAPGVTSKNMLNMLERNISVAKKIKYDEAIDLIIPSKNGNDLPSSICGRVTF